MNITKAVSKIVLLLVVLMFLLQITSQAEPAVDNEIGKLEYYRFCATCHGDDGKGDGPKAIQLSATPTNLTLLSKINGGTFPETAVYNIIDGRKVADYHGQEMPIWGEHLKEIEGNEEVVDERIGNLIEYLKNIQLK
ncbi:MAG: cytochrome c [Gammaproteobacteria bacterium]